MRQEEKTGERDESSDRFPHTLLLARLLLVSRLSHGVVFFGLPLLSANRLVLRVAPRERATSDLGHPSGDPNRCGLPPSLWFVNALWIGTEGVTGEGKRPGARPAAEMAKLANATFPFERIGIAETPEQR